MSRDIGKRASETRIIEITAKDLPVCCPPPGSRVWDAHPRVYLDLDSSNKAVCPYCGTKFVLKD